MQKPAFAMTIAGSDSGGGAGIQTDLKTFSALGTFGTCAITAITAQNTLGVRDVQAVSSQLVASQIDAVLEDFDIKAIKTGMIFTKDNVLAIERSLKKHNYSGKLIIDPVMIATSGDKLSSDDVIWEVCKRLFPLADLITPNIDEAEVLLGRKITSVNDMMPTAHQLVEKYDLKAALVKGGHLEGRLIDVFIIRGECIYFEDSERINTLNTHGTGCTLSAAIAAYCSQGQNIKEAYTNAKIFLNKALNTSKDFDLGHGHGACLYL